MWNSPRGGRTPEKDAFSVGAAYGRPRADEDIGPYTRKVARPAVHRPRCMLHHLGASYLVGAPASSTEQSGSDKVQTLFKRFPRRPGMPAKQRNSPGSGPAGPLLAPNHEPSGAVHGWKGGARERREGYPNLDVPNKADFATTRLLSFFGK